MSRKIVTTDEVLASSADQRENIELAINVSRLSDRLTGVARYVRSILDCWASEAPRGIDQIVMHSPRPVTDANELRTPWMRFHEGKSSLPPLLWENTVLPAHARSANVLFAPSFTMPVLAPTPPTVLLVYDALQALRPNDFGARGRVALPLMRASIRRADVLVTISEAAKSDIVEGFGVDPSQLHIVPGGIDSRFKSIDEFDSERLRRALGLGTNPYLVFVGKLSTRRNIPALISAAGILRARGFPHTLVLAGYNTTGLPIAALAADAEAEVVHVEGISDDLLVELYNGADVFVQAPDHESFSLPLLEAMACGTPTITSDGPGMREIGGQAPIYVDENTPQAIASAVESLLANDERRVAAIDNGLVHVRSFGWNDSAARLAELCVIASQR